MRGMDGVLKPEASEGHMSVCATHYSNENNNRDWDSWPGVPALRQQALDAATTLDSTLLTLYNQAS